MKKKLVLTLLASSTIAMSLVGCSSKTNNASIVIWAPAEEETTIQAVVKSYNESHNDQIVYTYKAVSESDGGTTLGTDPTVSNYPSIVACADDHLINLINKGIINPLGSTYSTAIKANDTAFAVTCVSHDDSVYAFPITSDNGYFLWYNSSAYTAEQVGKLETVLSVAKAAGKKVLMDVPNGWYANSFFMAQGICGTDSLKWTQTTETDGTKSTYYSINWDNDNGVASATAMLSLLKPYYDDGTLVTGGNDDITNGFTAGSMIAAISGTWMETLLKPVCSTLAAVKLPTITVGNAAHQMGSFAGTKAYVINAYASVEEQAAAIKLAEALTSEAGQLTRFTNRACVPCNKTAAASSTVTSNVTIGAKALAAQSAYAAVQSTSAETKYWDVGKAIGQFLLDGKYPEKVTSQTVQAFMTYECSLLRPSVS